MISQQESDLILRACKELPPAKGVYLVHDYITNLFLTVLDFMMLGKAVENAINYYQDNRWNELRDLDDLKRLLLEYQDDKEGNTAISLYLWNNRHWTRVSLLRKLVAYFESNGVVSQEALRSWANNSDFKRDFNGKVPGMGFAIYQWLIMRQGVETIKPDVHVRRFVESIIHRADVADEEIVSSLEEAAKQLGLKAYELDWRIWEHQRSLK